MPRLSSVFESRPEPGSILALLESSGSGARHLANTSIELAQRESPFWADCESGTDVEPLPLIDYHLLFILLNYCRPNLTSRELKRFDYLADARGFYYRAHFDFEYYYRGLQDVYTRGIILGMEKQKLELSGASNSRELEWNQAARIENLQEQEKALEDLETRRKNREQCTAWFSHMKVEFLKSEMPRLIYVGKHLFHNSLLPGKCTVLFQYLGSLRLTRVDNAPIYPSFPVDRRIRTSSRPATYPVGYGPYLLPHTEHGQTRQSYVKAVCSGETDECTAMDVDHDVSPQHFTAVDLIIVSKLTSLLVVTVTFLNTEVKRCSSC